MTVVKPVAAVVFDMDGLLLDSSGWPWSPWPAPVPRWATT